MRLVHGLESKLSPGAAVLYGLQHVLAMFVGIITPPLIISGALGLDVATTAFLVSMALFASGLTTFIQVKRLGPFGSGMLSVQGTSFTFVSPAIQAGMAGGLPLIIGLTIICSPIEMLLSRMIHVVRKLFPPIVTGSVVTLIGISLIKVGMTDMAGGFGATDFGSLPNLGMGFFVLLVIVLLNRFGRGYIGTVSIALGLIAGYLLSALLGRVNFTPVAEAGWLTLPRPFKFGIAFNPVYLMPWVIGYVITTIESIGDLTATSQVSGEPITGPVFIRRLEGGILSDGAGSMIAGIFNSMPNTTFSQNNGVIGLTGVASRRVGLAVAGLLTLLGLFPKLAALISVMPSPVLGGATVVMFSMVAVAGLRIIQHEGFNPRSEFILAITLALGLGVEMVPDAVAAIGKIQTDHSFLNAMLPGLQALMQSGLAVAAVTSTLLNLILPSEPSGSSPTDPQAGND
ncbi:MAG TPA: nucleobase:cation symporter-2 family protein [Kiritimatiellia bacterium]|nr:nucleobase:cation symporter-2 family protein [Kiritimatiellia bacterium]HPA77331.1 nucleobase:cation symporter-2 family protein [Kiritimatiellia bacterium]HQQ04366.1 nucleobase:cation symporter-2 family protein [Kiritimatiellia bacterium]